MKTIDLHTHTTYSDGSYTPDELIGYAIEKGLSAIAITDHDTVEGLFNITATDKIEVIDGIEVSTQYEEIEIHIVGLFVDKSNERLLSALKEYSRQRVEKNIEMVERLNACGLDLTYDDLLKTTSGNQLTRAHFARLMVERGFCSCNQECFDRYIGKGKVAYVERKRPDYKTVLGLLNEAGAVSILAHPLQYKLSDKVLEKMLKDLRGYGLKAMEVYYNSHTPSEVKHLKILAQKHGLRFSGGSDFHGLFKPKLDLGNGYGSLSVSYEVLEGLKEAKKNG